MKVFWLAAKIAAMMALVLAVGHAGILLLFFDVSRHQLHGVMVRLHAHEGLAVAQAVEAMVANGDALDGPAVAARLAAGPAGVDLRTRLVDVDVATRPGEERAHLRHPPFRGTLEVAGRTCLIRGRPFSRVLVPIRIDDETRAYVDVRGVGHAHAVHLAFRNGLGLIALASLVGVIAVTIFLTRPLRQMAGSMDRIAAGDLDHRVEARGRDEVAAMGRSFNSMADRIGAMIQGQKELLADVSHELRSPLARMKVALELLRAPRMSDARRDEHLDGLEHEVDAIDALVGEVLLASRFDLGTVPIEPHVLAIDEVVTAVARQTLAGDAPTLRFALAKGAEQVAADRALFERVVRNLLDNAARYAAGASVTVETARRNDDRVQVAVADDGPGVAADDRARLFEPFFRADRARTPGAGRGGTGLGLMIVRRAVEAHGGTVRAEASAGGGLRVVFDLPSADTAPSSTDP